MNFFRKLNTKNKFGIFDQGKNNNIINIICGILLILLIIVLIVCLVRKSDNFSNESLNLDNCVVIMFDREGCGFSAKMKKVVNANNNMIGDMKVCIIDMTKEKELAIKYNISGTPTFALKDNPMVTSSGLASLEVHENKLKKINTNKNSKKHKLIARDGCPFCTKAYELLHKLNIDYEKIDSNSPEGIKLMKEGNNGNGVNGVPYMICADGKEIIGYNEEEFKKLN